MNLHLNRIIQNIPLENGGRKFLDENFLLQSTTAQTLYHQFAKEMPVIDYHCHLSPEQIAEDKTFENLTQA